MQGRNTFRNKSGKRERNKRRNVGNKAEIAGIKAKLNMEIKARLNK